MRKSFRYRIYPTRRQEAVLDNQLRLCRNLYNMALDQRIWAYRTQGKSISVYEQKRQLTEMKAEFPEYFEVHTHVLGNTLRRLDNAYTRFFAGCGFPRFKNKDRFRTLQFDNTGFKLLAKKLRISKVGEVKIKLSRPLEGTVKTLSITRNSAGQWHACFSCVLDSAQAPQRLNLPAVGLDLGLEKFGVLSDGSVISNPRHARNNAQALADRQRKLTLKQGGSNNRSKAKTLVAKAHNKVSNQRRDFHFKLSNYLVSNYGRIVHERLDIKSMSHSDLGRPGVSGHLAAKKSGLNKSIADAGWGQFLDILRFKAENAGVEVIPVNPCFTSQTCSGCGIVAKKGLEVRQHSCACGLEIDRDWNAAINILRLGQSLADA